MENHFKLPRLSESLCAVRDSYFDSARKAAAEGKDHITLSNDQLRAMGRYLDQLVDQAQGLEHAERDLVQMEAVAVDFDPSAAPLQDMRRASLVQAAVSVPGSTVVVLPIVPRSQTGGGAA